MMLVNGRRIVAVIALVAIIVALCTIKWDAIDFGKGGDSGDDAAVAEAQTALTVEKLTPEQLERLTIEKYSNISQVMLDSSLSPQDKARTEKTGFSDALTFGFEASDDTGKFAELEEEILRNPVYGVTVAKSIMDKKIGDKTVGELNPWMETFVALHEKNGAAYWCEYRGDDKATIYVTDEYRQYAATLCTFLERLVPQGVHAWQTVENWCLNAAAQNNDRIGEPASYQYAKDALILSYVGKNDGADGTAEAGTGLFVIGFNVHDKRPEFYGVKPSIPEPEPEKTTPAASNPTPTNPSSSENKDSTPETKKDPENPKPKKQTTKNPADDPVNKGNAKKGGGDNKPSDGAGENQPVDPRTETKTGNENANNQGHSDPATVTPATPPVVEEHKQEEAKGDVVTHESKMDYAPDPVTDRGPADTKEQPTTSSGGAGEFTPDD